MTLTCPVCGKSEKANGDPFDSADSVAAHIQSSVGEHRGIGYEKAHLMVEHGDTDTEAIANDLDETDDADTESADPAKDAPDVDVPDDDGETVDPGPCPNCEGELIDFRDQETLQRDGRAWDTPDDFYCSECGRGWVHES